MTPKKKLGDLLVDAGAITGQQLSSALNHQKRWGGRLGEVLVSLNYLDEARLLDALSVALRLPCVDLASRRASAEAITLIPVEVAKRFNILPLSVKVESGKKELSLAMSDPTNLSAVDEIQFLTGMTVKPMISTDSSITDAIRFYYEGVGASPSLQDGPDTPGPRTREEPPDLVVIKEEGRARSRGVLDTAATLRALIRVLVDKGILTEEEIRRKMAAPAGTGERR